MAKLLPDDFREFLKLCNARRAKYLLIGGYAVNYFGYSRATSDMDVWIDRTSDNADKLVSVLRDFGFQTEDVTSELFMSKGNIVRMGVPPLRLEILNEISGLSFSDCYPKRLRVVIDGIKVDLISLEDLVQNKKASGRPKDLIDVDHLST